MRGVRGDSAGERWVTLLDIIGFRALIGNKSLSEAALLMRDLQQKLSHLQKPAPSGTLARVWKILYSDSILLYVEDESPSGLLSLIRETAQLIGVALGSGILLRGSLVRGDLYVSADQRVFLGESVVRAYDLEQGQKSAGALLDPLTVIRATDARFTMEEARRKDLVRRANVPWRTNPSPRPHWVVNWARATHGLTNDVILQRLERTMGRPDDEGWAIQQETLMLRRELLEPPDNRLGVHGGSFLA